MLEKNEERRRKEREEMFIKNKSRKKGLISADRNNKATLPLTIPSSTQVVCKGLDLSNIYFNSEAN